MLFFVRKLLFFVKKLSACKNRLEKLAMDKHSSLLQKFVNDIQKSFITMAPRISGVWIEKLDLWTSVLTILLPPVTLVRQKLFHFELNR
jgi:hypothetical protein